MQRDQRRNIHINVAAGNSELPDVQKAPPPYDIPARGPSANFHSVTAMPQCGAGPKNRARIPAGQPLNEQGGSMARRRFQTGRLFLSGKKAPKWIGRRR
jgi:hypothetical protein